MGCDLLTRTICTTGLHNLAKAPSHIHPEVSDQTSENAVGFSTQAGRKSIRSLRRIVFHRMGSIPNGTQIYVIPLPQHHIHTLVILCFALLSPLQTLLLKF